MPTFTGKFRQGTYVPGGSGGDPGDYWVTTEEDGTIFVTSGNTSHQHFYLPEAQPGLEYTFVCGKGPGPDGGIVSPFTVHASGTDYIRWPSFDTTAYRTVSMNGWWWTVRIMAVDEGSWITTHNRGLLETGLGP